MLLSFRLCCCYCCYCISCCYLSVCLSSLLLCFFNFSVWGYFVLEQIVVFNNNNMRAADSMRRRPPGGEATLSIARHAMVSSRHVLRYRKRLYTHSALCGAWPSTTHSLLCYNPGGQVSDTPARRDDAALRVALHRYLSHHSSHPESVAATRAARRGQSTTASRSKCPSNMRLLLPLGNTPMTFRRQGDETSAANDGRRLQIPWGSTASLSMLLPAAQWPIPGVSYSRRSL